MPDEHQTLRIVHEMVVDLNDFSEVLDELSAQVEQMKADQAAFMKSVNQRLNGHRKRAETEKYVGACIGLRPRSGTVVAGQVCDGTPRPHYFSLARPRAASSFSTGGPYA